MKLESGRILQNRYRVVREIEPELYRAWDSSLEQPRVLRVLPNAAASNRPIQLTQLHHSHLARINDVVPIDTARVLVMDYVDGQSINERVAERGQSLNLERVQRWANQIGDGLRHLHGRGITHGAVSADSIRITPSADAMLTNYAVNGGTTADDVRGLATAMYTMVTGRKPSNTPPNQINNAVSPAMNSAIVNGMNGRFNTVDAFLSALDQLTTPASTSPVNAANNDKTTVLDGAKQSTLQDKTTLLDTPSATYQSPTPATSSKKGFPLLPLLAGLFAVLLLGAGAFFVMNRGGDDDPVVEATTEPIGAVVETPPADSSPESDEPDGDATEIPELVSLADPTVPALAEVGALPFDPTENTAPPVTIGDVTYRQLMALPRIDDEGNDILSAQIDDLVFDDESNTIYALLGSEVILAIDGNTGANRLIEPYSVFENVRSVPVVVGKMALYGNGQMLVGSSASGVLLLDVATGQATKQFGLLSRFADDDSNPDLFIRDVDGLAVDQDGNVVVLTNAYEDSQFITLLKVFAPDGSLLRVEQFPFDVADHLSQDGDGNVIALQLEDETEEDYLSFLRLNTTDGDLVDSRFGQDALADLYGYTIDQFQGTDDQSILYGTRGDALILLDKDGSMVTTLSEYESCFDDEMTLQSYQTCGVGPVSISGDGKNIFFVTEVETLSYLVQIIR